MSSASSAGRRWAAGDDVLYVAVTRNRSSGCTRSVEMTSLHWKCPNPAIGRRQRADPNRTSVQRNRKTGLGFNDELGETNRLERHDPPTYFPIAPQAQAHVNHSDEVGMSQKLLDYLHREHARLEEEIEVLMKQRLADQIGIARLKKLKLAVKDQIAQMQSDAYPALVA